VLVAALVLALAACGGSAAVRTVHGVVPGSVAMTPTPSALLAVCRANTLLHPICPRLGPLANRSRATMRPLGICQDASGRDVVLGGHYSRLASSHCVLAGWGYEASGQLPFNPALGDRLSAWNGSRWVPLASESNLFSPPLHVHVEIQAARRDVATPDESPTRRERMTDALLTAPRSAPVDLGWVNWYGTHGQLILEPNYPAGGEWGGHLVYRFMRATTTYAITLHAWTAALRVTGPARTRVIRFQRGPALPHVIATLKTIVGSALQP
jgi:hypothetical protein